MELRRALISVTRKDGVEKFGELLKHGWEIISTGGTATYLRDHDVPCTLVEELTGFPEMLDGRVKTIHPKIHGGILAKRSDKSHMDAVTLHGLIKIDLVIVNLYAFSKNPSIENIDIGGPGLLRAAAKNCASVTTVFDPLDYDGVINEIISRGEVALRGREYLAMKVFAHTEAYDAEIKAWMRMKITAGQSINEPVVPSTH